MFCHNLDYQQKCQKIQKCSYSKKVYGSSCPLELASRITALIVSNEQMEDIMKIVKSLEE